MCVAYQSKEQNDQVSAETDEKSEMKMVLYVFFVEAMEIVCIL